MWTAYRRLINNTVFANVVLAAVIVSALMAAFTIQRESNPEIDIPFINITVDYPGADPAEVEEGVSKKVEAAVEGIQGIRRYFTTSSEGESRVTAEVADGYEPLVIKDRIQSAVDRIDDLPELAERPVVVQQTNSEEVLFVLVWGDLPERQLKEFAQQVHDDVEALPSASTANLHGYRDYEVNVEVSEDRLRQHDLTLQEVSDAIRRGSRDAAAGTVDLAGESIRLRTLGERDTGLELAELIVAATDGGDVVRLSDIATVRDAFTENDRYSRFNGKPAVGVSVRKAPGEDAIAIYDEVMAYIAETNQTLPQNVRITGGFDNTDFIQSQIRMITRNGLLGLMLVVLVLWVFLEPRLAFWVAMGIPISLGGALILLWLMGGSLNQISLLSMIVVMGIIVDDAIVVGEAIFVHRKQGKLPLNAAIDGVGEVGLPVLASVLTTMAAFAPMLFVPGLFGQFMVQMPTVVIVALLVSLVECFFLLPAHLNHAHSEPKRHHLKFQAPLRMRAWAAEGVDRFVDKVYAPFVRWAVDNRYVTLCGAITIILLSAGLVGGGFIQVIVWPGAEGDFAQGYVEFPPGTPAATVFDAVDRMERAAARVAERHETHNGDPLLRHYYGDAPNQVESGGRVIIEMTPTSNRDVTSSEFMVEWSSEIGVIPGALVLSFEGVSIGNSGDGGDIEYWLQGKDTAAVRAAAEDLKSRLRGFEGVYQIQDNFRPGKKELAVSLKPSASALGLTLDDLNAHLYNGYYGDEAIRIQRGTEDVRVRVRYPRADRQSLDQLYASRIETASGQRVPVRSVADFEFREGVSSISGVNGVTGIRVSAMVDKHAASPSKINGELTRTVLDEIVRTYSGVGWSLSGQEAENRELVQATLRNMLFSLLAIFIILCTVFRSYSQPFIIMLVIPYGLVGALLGHMLLGLPISFLSLGGIVALSGVLVNDSIVLIERANENLAEGLKLTDAVCKAGQRRFRAILLTSLSTCMGLTPLILEQDLQAQIVIPMAVSIAAGVAVGTLLTLVLIPAFLVILNDFRCMAARLRTGEWPTPESVEPARLRREVPTQEIRLPEAVEGT